MSLSPFLMVPSLVPLAAVPGVQRAQDTMLAHFEQHINRIPDRRAFHDLVTDTSFNDGELHRHATHLAYALEGSHVSR